VSAAPFRESTDEQVASLRERVQALEEDVRQLRREPAPLKVSWSPGAAVARMRGLDRLLLMFGVDLVVAWLGAGAYAHWGQALEWARVPGIVTAVICVLLTFFALVAAAP
jgi:hypothetical protein